MKKIYFSIGLLSVLFLIDLQSDTVIWKGTISSNGLPSQVIPLKLHDKYKIKASGYVNLGKWIQGGEKLANDACFEFNEHSQLNQVTSLKNTHDISLCDGTYHANHVYESGIFEAKHSKLHFWVDDTNYDDNTGSFNIEVIKIQ